MPVRRWSAWTHVAILGSYTLLTALMTWPLVINLATAIPGDSFDGWQNYWNLWWLKVALLERLQNPYVTDLLYAPTGVNLYFHTLNPLNGVATLPLQLSFGLLVAYNAVVFFSWVMGGYGVYLLSLWVLARNTNYESRDMASEQQSSSFPTLPSAFCIHFPAFLAGVIFTFSPFHMAHLLGHMQVMALEWVPFYVLYLLRAISRQQQGQPWGRAALLAGGFLTLAGLCDWYFVLYLFFFTGLVVLWQWGRQWIGFSKAIKKASLLRISLATLLPPVVAGVFFVLLFSPVLAPMLREATQFSFMVRPAADLYIFSASLADFFVPNRLHPLWLPTSLQWIGNQVAPPSEHTISLGYLPLLLTLVAVWRDRRRTAFWLFSALFFVLLALGPRLHLGNIFPTDIPVGSQVLEQWTPYALLNRLIPFMRISRSVSRYALMVQLSIAVAAALGLAALWRGKSSPVVREQVLDHARLPIGQLLSACLLLSLTLGEFWVAPFPVSPPDTPAFYTQLQTMPNRGAVLNLPMNYDRPGYLLYQTVHQKALTVGYISRDDPRTLTERAPILQHFRHLGPDILNVDVATVGLTVLSDLGVGTVVADRYKMPGGLERDYTEQLTHAIFAQQAPLYEDDRLTVYAVNQPNHLQPYLVLGDRNWGAFQPPTDSQTAHRLIGTKPAAIYVYHAPSTASLQIRYQTVLNLAIQVASFDGSKLLATLPPSTISTTMTVDISGLAGVTLQTERENGASIESLELIVN